MPTFLFVTLALVVLWAFVFASSKETRHEQLVMSVIGLVLSPGALVLASIDYRSGRGTTSTIVGAEDLLFAACLFGLAAVVYQVVFAKHTERLKGVRIKLSHPASHWVSHLLIAFGLWAFSSLALTLVLHLSSVEAFIVGGLLIGIYVIADRKDLLFNALLSGLLVAIMVFVVEQLFFMRIFPEASADFWQLGNLTGILLGGIPVEEILWAAVVGFAVGPIYEYMRQLVVK